MDVVLHSGGDYCARVNCRARGGALDAITAKLREIFTGNRNDKVACKSVGFVWKKPVHWHIGGKDSGTAENVSI
jgi:hypothetical protein